MSVARDEPRPAAPPRPRRWPMALVIILLTLSLLLHLWTLLTLDHVRLLARDQVLTLSEEIGQLGNEVVTLDVPVRDSIQISTTVPIRQELTIPVDTTITINQQITIPIDTPFGQVVLPVPVTAEVPIKVDVPVTIDERVPLNVPVELDLRVPVSIPLRATPLASHLDRLEVRLTTLARELEKAGAGDWRVNFCQTVGGPFCPPTAPAGTR